MKAKFIFSYIDNDENGIYKDMTSEKAKGIIEFLPDDLSVIFIILPNKSFSF